MKSLITDTASLLLGVVLASAAMVLLVSFGFIGFLLATLINVGMVIQPALKLVERRLLKKISSPWVYIVSGGIVGLLVPCAGFGAVAGIGGMLGPDFRGYYILSFLIGAGFGAAQAKRRIPDFRFKNYALSLRAAFEAWRRNRAPQLETPPIQKQGAAPEIKPPSLSAPKPSDSSTRGGPEDRVSPTPPKPSRAWLFLGTISELLSILFAVLALVSAGYTLFVIIPQSSKGTGFASALLLPAGIVFAVSAGAAVACWALRRRLGSLQHPKQ